MLALARAWPWPWPGQQEGGGYVLHLLHRAAAAAKKQSGTIQLQDLEPFPVLNLCN